MIRKLIDKILWKFGYKRFYKFTSGNGTWNIPKDCKNTHIKVTMVNGGGGGGGSVPIVQSEWKAVE